MLSLACIGDDETRRGIIARAACKVRQMETMIQIDKMIEFKFYYR